MTDSIENRSGIPDQRRSSGDDGIMLPLSAVLEFILRQDGAISQRVEELSGERPDMLSSGAEMVQHAGAIGIEAGKRLILERLASDVVAAAVREEQMALESQPTTQLAA